MTEPAPRRRTVTRWRALVLVATAAALLAGCELATGTVQTASELQKAGIRNPNLNYDGGTATLTYDADPNPLEARAEQDRAAAIIWENLPFRIEQITVTGDGGAFPSSRDYSRAELQQELGPRPADLDRSVEDIARQATLIAGVVALVVLLLIVLVIVLVVRAVRRRPAPQPAGAWPQGAPQQWNQQGWGQPPPPPQPPWNQPGYGQPPRPGYGQPGPPAPPAPPGYGQPLDPGWAQPPPAAPPPATRPEAGAEPPDQGPGDTQRLDPDPPPPPPGERGPTPPP